MHMNKLRFAFTALGALMAAPVGAATTLIDFNNITAQPYDNGTSFSGVQFANSGSQTYFEVVQFGSIPGDSAIRIGDASANVASALSMRFSGPMTSLSLLFGPDDPAFINPGDQAVMQLGFGPDIIDQVSVVMDRDGLANQTINYSGLTFDRALFYYANSAGDLTRGVPELVDNIVFSDDVIAPAVPEPATWALLLFGFGSVGLALRRRRCTPTAAAG
jgi:hypothetical protein